MRSVSSAFSAIPTTWIEAHSCLCGCLSHQSVIGQRFSSRSTPEHEAEELPFPPAAIEAVDELVQIARQVLAADAVERPSQPRLEVPEDRMRPGKDLGRASRIALHLPVVAD